MRRPANRVDIVLKEFVRDSFDDGRTTLEQLRFGEPQVLIFRGEHAAHAAVIQGRYLNGLSRKLQVAVWEFERSQADILAKWDGNIALLPQADAIRAAFHPLAAPVSPELSACIRTADIEPASVISVAPE